MSEEAQTQTPAEEILDTIDRAYDLLSEARKAVNQLEKLIDALWGRI